MNIKRIMGAANRGLYRLSGGKIGGKFFGAPVLLLTTTGRKSGKPRTMPLLYLDDGERFVVVASAGGQPQHPAWLTNLRANPDVEVELGRERIPMRAREASGDERDRYWTRVVAMYKQYESYQQKTTRQIPLVVLERPNQGQS